MARTGPENTGSKKKAIFWFSLGVLHGFSRKSNEDEFFRKSNGGGGGSNRSKKYREQKKAYNISEISEIKGNFENVNMNSK